MHSMPFGGLRSTKNRLFIYILAICGFGLVFFMFHGSQQQLENSQKALASCNQQTESLSAQLQVIFEYKLRLEKSLQKEKIDHKQTRADCLVKEKRSKDEQERELVEAANKYSALQQSTNLLQSKQKDLEEENSQLRKKNLKLSEEMEVQKKQLTSKLIEEQRLRSEKEKSIENVKSKSLALEVKYNKLAEDYEMIKKQLPESSRIQSLEKVKIQLERELEEVKTKLETCSSDLQQTGKKVSVGGLGDNQAGVEPPKFVFVNKQGTNSTTPVINPEAVIDHDVPSPKPALNKSTSAGETNNKPTQAAAAPIQNPLKQVDNNMNDLEMNRQIPMPNNLEPQVPQQMPENTVIKKPEYADAAKHKGDVADENHGREVGDQGVVAGPMNPIQEPVAPPPQSPDKNKMLNAIQWEEEGQQNGAHEEGEEEAAPRGWRGGEVVDSKLLPKHINHDYNGGDYDKDNQEEEEDEEGEQMDYLGGDNALKRHKQMAKIRQFDRNAGGGIMLNPK